MTHSGAHCRERGRGDLPGDTRTAALDTPVAVLGHSGSQGGHAGARRGRQHMYTAAPSFAKEGLS